MIVKKEWSKLNKWGEGKIYKGIFLFGFIPLYISVRRV